MSVFFIFFRPIRSRPANQQFLVYGDASGCISVNFLADKKPFCRGRLLHLDEDATLLSMLQVALGDNKSLHASHLNFRDQTKQEKTGAMSFFTSSWKTINDQAKLEPKNKKLETSASRSLHVRTWPTVQHTHTHTHARARARCARPGQLWQRRFLAARLPIYTGTRVTVPYTWIVEVGIPDLRVKKISAQKNQPPARKNLTHIS